VEKRLKAAVFELLPWQLTLSALAEILAHPTMNRSPSTPDLIGGTAELMTSGRTLAQPRASADSGMNGTSHCL